MRLDLLYDHVGRSKVKGQRYSKCPRKVWFYNIKEKISTIESDFPKQELYNKGNEQWT